MSEISDFKEYVEEQRHLCYGVEGETPGVHGRIARQYDFLLETIDTYQEINQPQLNENQQIVLDWLKSRAKGGNSPFAVVQGFRGFNGVPSLEINSLISLSIAEESQVLQVFSQWALEQEAE
ncbi:hypothetical protein ACFC53_03450 [Enterococcus casseliflavus]|uniref:hypothetical protein n=1 Tax=Enterococcus casseliflavus TaxID=37734 RepID=UPI0035D80A89